MVCNLGTARKRKREAQREKRGRDLVLNKILETEILTRLPVKSLANFRCVSKFWYSLISYNKVFIESHLKNSTNNKSLIALVSSKILKECPLPCLFHEPSSFTIDKFTNINANFIPPLGLKVIIGTCNGLCCLKVLDNKGPDYFFLWNPATGISHKLPAAYVEPYRVVCAGFGYDEVHDDYKVLAITFDDGDGVDRIVMLGLYSLRANSWKAVENNFFKQGRTWFNATSGTFFNGKLHWAAEDDEPYMMIYCFDLEKEVHGTVELPDYDRHTCYLHNVGVLDGCLSCVTIKRDHSMNVWVMKRYGMRESWHLLASFPLCEITPELLYDHRSGPLCIGQGGVILFSHESCGCFLMYDPKTKSFTYFSWPGRWSDHSACIYVQSLVSPLPPASSNLISTREDVEVVLNRLNA